MTTPPPEGSPPLATPTVEETRAITNAFSDEEILALAKQIQESGALGFDPTTIVKGIVTAVNTTGSPPTVTINISGDTTTAIASIRILNNYSPVVGHTVLIAKQGADIVVLGHVADLGGAAVSNGAGGWVKATLAGGSHNADSQGDVYYRRILDHGAWKMQWQGGWGVSGTVMVTALDAEYRPRVKRPLLAARQFSTGATACHMVFHTDGKVEMQGATQAINSGTVSGDIGFTDPIDNTTYVDPVDFSTADATDGHSHGVVGGHDHGVVGGHDHSFSGGAHTHPVTAPTWVSLNGLEYFL
jgi:hypothetical protein